MDSEPKSRKKITKLAVNDETRALVKKMAMCAINQEAIARFLDISHDTLSRNFREELDTAMTHANTQVAYSLFQNALNGNVAAQIFWLKCRARWKAEPEEERRELVPVLTIDITDETKK